MNEPSVYINKIHCLVCPISKSKFMNSLYDNIVKKIDIHNNQLIYEQNRQNNIYSKSAHANANAIKK